jgi:hypothetical protein
MRSNARSKAITRGWRACDPSFCATISWPVTSSAIITGAYAVLSCVQAHLAHDARRLHRGSRAFPPQGETALTRSQAHVPL